MSSTAREGTRPETLSLTARLTILSTLATTCVLLFVIVFQFLALASDLEFEDNNFIIEKIRVIEAVIARHPDDSAHLDQEVNWEGAMRQDTRYLVRIMGRQGNVVMETRGMDRIVPARQFPPPARDSRAIGQGKKLHVPDGRIYLLNSAWGTSEKGLSSRVIQVALDVTDDEEILEGYKKKMAFVFLAGICLSAALSAVVVRRGLRPLAEITGAAGRIDITTLDERLGARVWPRELARFAAAFDGMLDRLETSFDRLEASSANLAHEIRTPINILRGEAEEAISRVRSSEEYRRVIESSLEEYERLSRLIDNILFLARAEQRIEPIPLNMRGELELLLDFYGTLAEEKEITISCSGRGEIHADPLLFQRAVGNLLSNAIRYTPAGGAITVSCIRDDDGSARLTVTDTGIGIAPDDLPRIFDRFYRSSEARALNAQGTGLGLAIVRSIMDLHGGGVSVSSEPRRGTAVTLHFPAITAPS
ncbi:heavy metal sensor histidine kinase [Geobacter hydrogenophilus]|uniref:histidine kinase n=1 Tax=Geobacter hydrogenophilus TaxID=40983 RepID=A0A9W6G1B9_9BACT|nr:heavy metal sensor histidine kinase [Geobacter hydrogenophilus]MBT0894149.1 heavy metal sensor histidine kinase [Geobacter hydrogenophilus]GLI38568.1 two-component sensor histidine kinase [Geobacter hydrogenophilus]